MGGFAGLSGSPTDDVWTWTASSGWHRQALVEDALRGGGAIAVDRERARFLCFTPDPTIASQGLLWAIRPSAPTLREDLGSTPFGQIVDATLDGDDRLWLLARGGSGSTVMDLWWRSLADTGTWRRVGSLPSTTFFLPGSWHFDRLHQRHLFVTAPSGAPPSLWSFSATGGATSVVYPLHQLQPFGWAVNAFVDTDRRRLLVASSADGGVPGSSAAIARLDVISLDTLGSAHQLAVALTDPPGQRPFANFGLNASGFWAVWGDPAVPIRRADVDSLASWRLVADSGPSPRARDYSFPTEPFVLEDDVSGWLLGEHLGFGVRDWSLLWQLDLRDERVRWTGARIAGVVPESTGISATTYSPDERRWYAVGPDAVWAFDLEPTPHWSRLGSSGPGFAPSGLAFDPLRRRLWADDGSLAYWSLDGGEWRRLTAACPADSILDPYPRLSYDARHERLLRSDRAGVRSHTMGDYSCWKLELRTSGFGLSDAEVPRWRSSGDGQPYPLPLPPSSARTLLIDERRGELHLDGGLHSFYTQSVSYGQAVSLTTPIAGARDVSGHPIPVRNGRAVALAPASDRIVLAMGPQVWTWPAGNTELPWAIALPVVQAPGAVRLAWRVATAFASPATLWRRTPTDAWQMIARLSPDASGAFSFEDPAAIAGHRFGYRLTRGDRMTDLASRDQWLVRETRAEFALHHAWPNPSSGHLTLSFALAHPGAARFELFDLSGRRVWLETRAAQSGQQLASLELPTRVHAGVYLLRVVSGGERRSARIAVIR